MATDRATPKILRRVPSLLHLDGIEGIDGLQEVAAGIGDHFAWYRFMDDSEWVLRGCCLLQPWGRVEGPPHEMPPSQPSLATTTWIIHAVFARA